jgi:hypothetical protein
MKKTLLLIAIALFVSSTAFSQFKFGVGVIAGTKAGIKEITGGGFESKVNFGLNARGIYKINETLAATGGISYFLPVKIYDGATKSTQITFNAGANLYLLNGEKSKLYGYGGFNWTSYKVEITTLPDQTTKGTGFEFGGGVEFGSLFIEVKYDTNTKQMYGVAGFLF